MERGLIVGIALSAGVLALASTAGAQTESDLATRRVLLEQAQAAHDANDHTRALDLATRAAAIQDTPSVRMFLAEEQIALGQFAEAFGSADLCVRNAERDPGLRSRDTILARCRAALVRARDQLGYVTLNVPAQHPAGLVTTVNGSHVSEAIWGVPAAATAGHVVVEATAGGRVLFHREIDVARGATMPIDVTLAEPTATPPSATSGTPAPASSSHSPTTAHTDDHASGGISTPAIAVAVAGVVSLIVSGVFFGLRESALSGCHGDGMGHELCDTPEHLATARNNAPTDDIVANSTLIAGGVLLLGGVAWAAVGALGGGSERRARIGVTPLAGGGALLGVGGTF